MPGTGEKVPWSYGIGLAVPDPRVTLDKETSTYTERAPVPAAAEPQNSTRLTVTPKATAPDVGVTLEARTQRGGLVGGERPAELVWRESAGDWFGQEEQALHRARVLIQASATDPSTLLTKHPHSLTLPDGSVLIACQVQAVAASAHRIVVGRLGVDGGFTTVVVHSQISAPGGDGFRPCLVPDPSGRIILYAWAFDAGAETAQIMAFHSDDNGTVWSFMSDAVLDEAIDVSSSGYATRRIRPAPADGGVILLVQVLAAAGLVSDYRDQTWQYASRDFGNGFRLIDKTDEAASDDGLKAAVAPEVITTAAEEIVAAWIGPATTHLYVQKIANPFDSLFDSPPAVLASSAERCLTTGTPVVATDYELGLCEDHGGALYITSKIPTSTGRHSQQLHRSDDGGSTWDALGYGPLLGANGACWWRSHSAGLRPNSIHLAAQDGRRLAIGNCVTAAGTYDSSLYVFAVGFPSTSTLPRYLRTDARKAQVTWGYTWAGFGSPDEGGYTGEVTGGSFTKTLGPDYVDYDTSLGQIYNVDTVPGTSLTTATTGTIQERTLSVASGGSLSTDQVLFEVSVEDGSNTYTVSVRFAAGSARVRDVVAGADLATVSGLDPAKEYDWRIAVADGQASVKYRESEWTGKARWVVVIEDATVSDGGASLPQIVTRWGHVATGVAVSRWLRAGTAYDDYTGQQATDVFSNPDDLVGRPWSPAGAPVGRDGTVLEAVGATVQGDEWHVSPGSSFEVDNMLRGGPRTPHETVDTSEAVYDLDFGAGEDTATLTDVITISGFDTNYRIVEFYGVPASGVPVLLAQVDLADGLDDLPYDMKGDRVRPDTSAPSDVNTPVYALAEATGDYFVDDTNTAYRIRTNRSGRWTQAADRNRAVLFLEPREAAPAGLPSTGTGTAGAIVPHNWSVAIDLHGREYEKIRMVIPASPLQISPPEGRWRTGRLAGPFALITMGYLPSWGDRVAHSPQRETYESRDVQRTGLRLAPTRRRFRIGFVDGVRQFNVVNVAGDEDGEWFNLSDDADAEGAGQFGMVLQSLAGILELTGGAVHELVYHTHVARFTSGVEAQLYNRRHQVGLVYMDSDVVKDRVVGRTLDGDLVRGEIVDLPEAI